MFEHYEMVEEWLQLFDIKNYIIREDLTVDVNGEVDLFRRNLAYLPVQFGIIHGDFSLRGNSLVSLKGSPYEVKGNFDCMFNQITSLEFCPRIVGRDFFCQDNQLTSLKYSPEQVNGSYHFNINKVTSLEYITPIIGNNLNGEDNQLTDLYHFPHVGKNIYLSNNAITSLKGIQTTIDGNLKIANNPLVNFDDMPHHIHGYFDCTDISFSYHDFDYQHIFIDETIRFTCDNTLFLVPLKHSFFENILNIDYPDLQSYFLKKQLHDNLLDKLDEKNTLHQRKI